MMTVMQCECSLESHQLCSVNALLNHISHAVGMIYVISHQTKYQDLGSEQGARRGRFTEYETEDRTGFRKEWCATACVID